MKDGDWYPPPSPPKNPAFEEIWGDRRAAGESDLFEDIELSAEEVVSALTKDDANATSKGITKKSRRRKILIVSTFLVLGLGIVATICAVKANTDAASSDDIHGSAPVVTVQEPSGKTRSSKDASAHAVTSEKPSLTSNEESTEASTTPTTSSSTPSTSTSSPAIEEVEPTAETETSSTVSTDEDKIDSGICIPDITFRYDLLEDTEDCDDCSSFVVLDVNRAVVRYNDKIFFYSLKGDTFVLSSTALRGTSSDIGLAISGDITVLSDFVTDDLNRDLFVIDNNSLEDDDGEDVQNSILSLNTEAYDELDFGKSIDIDDDLMVVVAEGAAHVYEFGFEMGQYQQDWYLYTVLTLDEENESNDEFFATSVAVKDGKIALTGFNEEAQAAVFVYEKNPMTHFYEMMEEIVVDSCDEEDECDDDVVDLISLAFTDDGHLMVGHQGKDNVSYLERSLDDDEVSSYELEQEIKLPDGFQSDGVEVSGGVAVVSSSAKSSILVLVKDLDAGWKVATTLAYDEELHSIALSESNLMVSVGREVRWYTLDGCEI